MYVSNKRLQQLTSAKGRTQIFPVNVDHDFDLEEVVPVRILGNAGDTWEGRCASLKDQDGQLFAVYPKPAVRRSNFGFGLAQVRRLCEPDEKPYMTSFMFRTCKTKSVYQVEIDAMRINRGNHHVPQPDLCFVYGQGAKIHDIMIGAMLCGYRDGSEMGDDSEFGLKLASLVREEDQKGMAAALALSLGRAASILSGKPLFKTEATVLFRGYKVGRDIRTEPLAYACADGACTDWVIQKLHRDGYFRGVVNNRAQVNGTFVFTTSINHGTMRGFKSDREFENEYGSQDDADSSDEHEEEFGYATNLEYD